MYAQIERHRYNNPLNIYYDILFNFMEVIVELSKEHPTLPVAEVRACLDACDIEYEELYHNSVFFARINKRISEFADRIAMSFSINEFLGYTIDECVENANIKGTFKVEGGTYSMRKELGEKIREKSRAKVDLENPDTIIKIFSERKLFFAREIAKIERRYFEGRRPPKRPFSPPVSMHPRIARALVNLTRVHRSETLLDPFCGTGGILIEAGMIGAKVIGIDIKKKMVEGCKKNLDYYGIHNYELFNEDMREFEGGADAIATDFPYGRSSHLSDEMEKLYEEAFEKMGEMLNKERRAVVGLPSLRYRDIAKKYFKIEEIHCVRVHKNLTRFFYVLLRF